MKNDDYLPIVTRPKLRRNYDSMEFTLANGLSDYDVAANVTGAFENLSSYTTINVRTDQAITLKINSTDNRLITATAARPLELDDLMEITNIYLSNSSGSTANIKIIGVRKGD